MTPVVVRRDDDAAVAAQLQREARVHDEALGPADTEVGVDEDHLHHGGVRVHAVLTR